MSTVIKVENLSKRYRIGMKEKRKDTLFGQIGSMLRAPIDNFRQLRSLSRFGEEDESVFWALRDINFEVQQGEVLGIIGHNGAGKSTLLKILSRITEPTGGKVRVKGRVAALLEVGTGFHQELTGSENIYMNGTILGMTRREIDRKFDEIVDFSGVEKYIDTPVKFYSSGMKVRLGFAVAAHLEPEIMIIDEVLAVGDAEFQKKCLNKMESVAGEGRTVLFVSHNMSLMKRLCEKSLLLDKGRIVYNGNIDASINKYFNQGQSKAWKKYFNNHDQKNIALLNGEIRSKKGRGVVEIDESFSIEIKHKNFSEEKVTVVVHVHDQSGNVLFASNSFSDLNWWNNEPNIGVFTSKCTIPSNFLAEGTHFVSIGLATYNPNKVHVFEKNVLMFDVVDKTFKEGARGEYTGGNWPGLIRPKLNWNVQKEK